MKYTLNNLEDNGVKALTAVLYFVQDREPSSLYVVLDEWLRFIRTISS